VAAADDIYRQRQINNLKDTAQGLKESQSLLEGQLAEVQFGLQEGKAKEKEFFQQLSIVKEQLQDTSLQAEEIKELKLQQEALAEMVKMNDLQQEQMKASQDFLFEQQERFTDSLALLEDKSELTAHGLQQLKELSHTEQKRLDGFLDSFSILEEKHNHLESKVNTLYSEHLELTERLTQVESRTVQIDEELQQLKAELLQLKTPEKKSRIVKN
jgi:chromosome segregation ATPase